MRFGIKLFAVFLVAVAAISGAMTAAVNAHVLQSDKGVSAVLHIPPDDAPIAQAPTQLKFEMKDESRPNVARECQCTVTVTQDTSTVYEADLTAEGNSSGAIEMIFPTNGVYDIALSGKAAENGQVFNLSYTQRVTAPSSQSSRENALAGLRVLLITAGALIILAIISVQTISAGGRYAKKPHKARRKL